MLVGVCVPDTAVFRPLGTIPGGTYSLRLLLRVWEAFKDVAVCCSETEGTSPTYALRFFGGELEEERDVRDA